MFSFNQILSQKEWFYQNPLEQNIYWLSVAAVYRDPTQVQNPWGWTTRPRDPKSPAPDDGVRIFSPTAPVSDSTFKSGEPISWPDAARSWDLFFSLGGALQSKWEQPPQPYSLANAFTSWDQRSIDGQAVVADDWFCRYLETWKLTQRQGRRFWNTRRPRCCWSRQPSRPAQCGVAKAG